VESVFRPIRFLLPVCRLCWLLSTLNLHFVQYGIPMWRLWPNMRFMPSTVTETNATTVFNERKDGRTDRRAEVTQHSPSPSFIEVPHIVGSVFGPIRILLPVCRLCWFFYTFSIHLYMHIFRRIFLWPNIIFPPSIVAEKNATTNGHIQNVCSMWIKISKIGKRKAFVDLSDSYFLFAEERRYHKLALAHSSSCLN
jgi:hypothetical protein